ncbi:hypothetical protein PtA15_13A16 [Puccinia triticina]|uniref:CSC1/OSCA1-like 7TM region domain-containing protein n=1 Tax=Puccinia triticina TaxID=208348 RepID=A0ABY7D0D5_9BASI|nr:uncharacterized protein PtA15_13A16 [Puccinia triticina]WAQ90618.1 hypothetical protein PtA15_13A16 [Puccinia triticina]
MSDPLMNFRAAHLINQLDQSAPPGSPVDRNNRLKHGNWFETQLVLSLGIGSLAFLTFCYSRARSTLTFAPRTHLSSFSPHPVHLKSGFFSWILPTLKTSEHTVLQIVGLDAVVLLYFFKLGFFYFLTCTIFAFLFLVPINIHENGTTEGVPPDPPSPKTLRALGHQVTHPLNFLFSDDKYSWPDLTKNVTIYHCVHLAFTYFFSLLLLRFLKITYLRFIDTKPIFSLAHHSSVPLRTLLIENLPLHLRNDEALFEYFNDLLRFKVESVNVVRDVSGLVPLLRRRTNALINLEEAWAKWLGNPVRGEAALNYHPEEELARIIYHPRDDQPLNSYLSSSDHNASVRSPANPPDSTPFPTQPSLLHPSLKQLSAVPRPTFRPHWFSRKKVDLIDHLTAEFQQADDLVQRRRKGNFRCHSTGFVTFKSFVDAQTLCQVSHWPKPGQAIISLAPEPRDIYWSNLTISRWSIKARNVMVLLSIAALYGFWATPVTFLAKWMSYDTLVSLLSPKLIQWIEKSPTIKALIQNSLPTLAIIIFNALLPLLLDWLSTMQGFKAKSLIEYSLMKKYHLFLLITVFFIFVAVSTVSLLRDLRDNPAQFIDKIASSLPGARDFFISYLMLQSMAIVPLQLLQLPGQVSRFFYRLFSGLHTPRRHSELKNMHLEVLSLGTIYPQALLVFTIGITYSVIAPIILVFGTVYFGMAYLVYKYKVLNVYYRAFESQGQAWPIACNRIGWALIIFQIFMLGLLSLRQVFLLSTLVIPLILYTIQQLIRLESVYGRHSQFTSLSQLRESQRKEDEDNGLGDEDRIETTLRPSPSHRSKFSSSNRLRKSSVTQSQTNLNVKRYNRKDETLFIPGETEYTDNTEPPMSTVYWGILDTGTNRYAHPAISGRMPLPQLPVIRGSASDKANDTQPGKKRYELPQYRASNADSPQSSGQSLRTLGKFNRRGQGSEDSRENGGLLDVTPEVGESEEDDHASDAQQSHEHKTLKGKNRK